MASSPLYTQDRLSLNHTLKIIAIFGAKGGIGKTLLAIALSIILAVRGKNVLLVDLDGNPGTTEQFLGLEAEYGHRANLANELRDNPMQYTVNRLLLQPEDGLEDITLDFPMKRLFLDMPQVKRYKVSKVPADIVQQTMAFYGVADITKLGKLMCVPNAGTFQQFYDDATRLEIKNPTFKKDWMLRDALWHLAAQLAAYGPGEGIDYVIIDTAGERGLLPRNAAFAADEAILPFNMTKMSVSGVINTRADLALVQRQRKDIPHDQGLVIKPALLNRFKTSEEDSELDWIQSVALPLLQAAGMDLCDILIPEDPDAGTRPDRLGVVPFLYHPMSRAMQAIGKYVMKEFA